MAANTAAAPAVIPSSGPKQAGIVLATLIVVSAVANLPLAMANVALPSIGVYFDASQTQLNLSSSRPPRQNALAATLGDGQESRRRPLLSWPELSPGSVRPTLEL